MSDFLKSVFDAWDERIRSPILGSLLFSYVAFNWQPLFYLFFADQPVAVRLRFVELNTDFKSLIVCPLAVGLVIALAAPWINVVGAWFAKFPNLRLSNLQAREASERRVNELNLQADVLIAEARRDAAQQEAIAEVEAAKEEAIARVNAAREEAKLEAAERLKRADEIGDSAKEELLATRTDSTEASVDNDAPVWGDVDQIIQRTPKLDRSILMFLGNRTKISGQTERNWYSWLDEEEIEEVIQAISTSLSTQIDRRRAKVEFEAAIPRLLESKLLIESSDHSFGAGRRTIHRIGFTSKGYAVLDALQKLAETH